MREILDYQKFIISPQHNTFLWFPPKSSSTILSWIFTYFDFRPYCINPQTNTLEFDPPIQTNFGHAFNYPPDYENMNFLVSVRNPYERIFSFFKMTRYSYAATKRNYPTPTRQDFEKFFYEDFLGKETQRRIMVPVFDKKLPNYVIRKENILEDLLKIDFIKNSKINQLGVLDDMCSRVINNTPSLPIENYLTSQIKEKIYEIFMVEFEIGNYKK